MASFLDPRTKDLVFMGDIDKAEIIKMVKIAMYKMSKSRAVRAPPVVAPAEREKRSGGSVKCLAIFKNLSKGANPPDAMPTDTAKEILVGRINHEIKQYQDNVPQMPMTDDMGRYNNPLADFWAKKQTDFPLLSEIARSTLCIPATSAPSERVFSQAGLTITKLRASLTADNASKLIFLHDTWNIAEEYQKKRVDNSNGGSDMKNPIIV
jgi:hAT family C-terminal dimerisation region